MNTALNREIAFSKIDEELSTAEAGRMARLAPAGLRVLPIAHLRRGVGRLLIGAGEWIHGASTGGRAGTATAS